LHVTVELVGSADQSVLEKDILAYLARHPDAQGTLEAITEWWLLEQCIERTTADVSDVLAGLVARNVVKRVRRQDGHVYYCLPQRRQH
jgi:hypothetical protein